MENLYNAIDVFSQLLLLEYFDVNVTMNMEQHSSNFKLTL